MGTFTEKLELKIEVQAKDIREKGNKTKKLKAEGTINRQKCTDIQFLISNAMATAML